MMSSTREAEYATIGHLGRSQTLQLDDEDEILSIVDRLFGVGLVLESVCQVVPSSTADRLQAVVEEIDLTITDLRRTLCRHSLSARGVSGPTHDPQG